MTFAFQIIESMVIVVIRQFVVQTNYATSTGIVLIFLAYLIASVEWDMWVSFAISVHHILTVTQFVLKVCAIS